MVVGVPVVHVMVRCGVVRRLGWVACGGRLRAGVVVMQLVGIDVVLGPLGGRGFWGGGVVVMSLVVPCPLALRECCSLYGVDVCARWSSAGLPGWGAVVRLRCSVLVRVVLLVCPGGPGMGWCGVAGPGSRLGCRALLVGALAGPMTCLGLLRLVGVGSG